MARDLDGIIQEKFAVDGDVGLEGLDILEGWPISYSTPGGIPPKRLQFNQLYRNLFALAKEINQKGPYLEYNNTINYEVRAGVVASDGLLYEAVVPNGPDSSVVDPVGNPSTWSELSSDINSLFDLIQIASPKDTQVSSTSNFYDGISGGGHPYSWGATIDKATANGGTIIDPDTIGGWDGTQATIAATYYGASGQGTGVGTGCWVIQDAEKVSVRSFGAAGTGLVLDDAAIDAAISAMFALVEKVDIALPGYSGLKDSGNTLLFDGKFLCATEKLLYSGFDYEIPVASRIIADTLGMTMFRSTSSTERADSYYSSKNLRVTGGGIIDGINKATIGILADTVSEDSVFDITIIRCSHRRASTTGSGTSGSPTLTLASSTNIQELDVIEIDNDDHGYYSIISLTGDIATLDRSLASTVAADTVTVRGVGLLGAMFQQSRVNGVCKDNDIGMVLTSNRDGFGCTDMDTGNHCTNNNIGAVWLASLGCVSSSQTLQHNFGSELILRDCQANRIVTPYIESTGDDAADTRNPPGLGTPITAAGLRAFAMVDIKGGQGNILLDVHWPINEASTTFRRLIKNEGTSTIVEGIETLSTVLPENPDRAGDFALCEQNSEAGNLTVNKVVGPVGLTDLVLIVDETGALPSSVRAAWSTIVNSREYIHSENNRQYLSGSGVTAIDYYVSGEAQPRIRVATGGISIGGGVLAPTRVLSAQGVTVTDPTGGATIDTEARTAIIAIIDRLQAHGLIS